MKKSIYLLVAFIALSFCQSPLVYAQVGISIPGNTPDSSAGLDVSFTNKGLLMPRVSLSSTTDLTTIPSPATYLTVYNTNAAMTNGNGVGMYYYDGSKWIYMAAASNSPGSSGQVLTSGGTGTAPTWATPSACPANVQTFTSTGTWTKPSCGTMARIQLWGGGGSGKRSGSTSTATGGGGGGYSEQLVPLSTLSATVAVTIGAGGASQTTGSNATGNDGQNSTFGAYLTAYGGGGAGRNGLGPSGGPSGGYGGGGGSPNGGSYDTYANYGVQGSTFGGGGGGWYNNGANGSPSVYGGGGGASYLGSSTVYIGGASAYGGAGGNTLQPGAQPAGGGGGSGTVPSGKGGDGKCVVTVW